MNAEIEQEYEKLSKKVHDPREYLCRAQAPSAASLNGQAGVGSEPVV